MVTAWLAYSTATFLFELIAKIPPSSSGNAGSLVQSSSNDRGLVRNGNTHRLTIGEKLRGSFGLPDIVTDEFESENTLDPQAK